jgi:hypothetical protein
MARRQIESGIQRDIVHFLRAVLPNAVVMAIPNGSQRTATGRPANAVPGFLPGAPDLVIALSGGATLWMEVKSPTGRTSDNQILVHGLLNAAGHKCVVVRSIDDVRQALDFLEIKTREWRP